MASIVRSGTRRGEPVTMRLTRHELRLLLRAMDYAVGGETCEACPPFYPMPETVQRLIAAMDMFLRNEASGSPASAKTPARNVEVE